MMQIYKKWLWKQWSLLRMGSRDDSSFLDWLAPIESIVQTYYSPRFAIRVRVSDIN